ncbi:hypothetical protein Tco_0358940 [Tanacetum coccineum]
MEDLSVDLNNSDVETTYDMDGDQLDVESKSSSALGKKEEHCNYGQWHASSTKTDIECISIHDLVDIVDSFNMDLPVPSLSNLFSNAINVYSRTTITRDGNVQSFCGLKLTNIDMQGSAGQLPGANPERTSEKRKNIASTSRQPLNTPQSYITVRRQRRASATMPKRAALTSAGASVSYCNLGPPSYVCRNCNAQMWYEERTNKGNRATNPSFSLCCQEGKVLLPRYKPTPPPLDRLLNFQDHGTSKFRDQIRIYNGMFCFTSFGARIDHSINTGRGLYTFRINGQNYHRIGSLLPTAGFQPRYAQLYFFDTHNEVKNSMSAFLGGEMAEVVDATIVASLITMLDEISVVAQAFRMARFVPFT